MVEASSANTYDSATLTALLQSSNERSGRASEDSEEDSDDTGAPSAAAYEGSSGGAVDVLGGLLDKARGQLDEERKAETNGANAYALLKQSL